LRTARQACATCAAVEVVRAGHRHPAQRPQRAGHDALVGDDAGPQRGVETFLDQVDQAVAQHRFHLQLRMPLQQGRQQRHQHFAPEHRRCADLQRARRRARAVRQLPLGILQAAQQGGDLFDELAAVRGQRHVAGVPLQQLHSQCGLQPADRAREPGLAQAELAGRHGEAARLGHPYQHAHGIEVHRGSIHAFDHRRYGHSWVY